MAFRSAQKRQLNVLVRNSIPLTHIRASNFCPTFFQAVLNVFLFVTLVVSQASDEVVEGFFEPRKVLGAGNV